MSRPKLFSEIKGQIHDASGIVSSPHTFYWYEVNKIWYPLIGEDKPEVFARKCDITGKGFNEGYCFGNGEEYAIDEASALQIAKNRGYESLDEAFEDGDYYYSDWVIDPDNEECYDEDGNIVSTPEDIKVETQLELQKEIVRKAGINIVTCGHCGTVLFHRVNTNEITCPDCKVTSDPCDFPDLNF